MLFKGVLLIATDVNVLDGVGGHVHGEVVVKVREVGIKTVIHCLIDKWFFDLTNILSSNMCFLMCLSLNILLVK